MEPNNNASPTVTNAREVLLGYSGGVDSTVAALKLSETFDKLHLITYKTGTLLFVSQSRKNLYLLQDNLGKGRIHHEIVNIKELCRLMKRGYGKDYLTYCNGSAPAILCASCKIAMHTRNVIYCLEHGIPAAADGSVRTQSDHPEMMPGVLNEWARFYAEHNVRFDVPIYDFGSKDDELAYLREKGYRLGPKFGESDYRTIQPVCMQGPFYSVWHLVSPNTEEQVVPYVQKKLVTAREYIRSYFEKKGQDLDEVKSKLPRVTPIHISSMDPSDDQVKLMGVLGGQRDKLLGNALQPLWWLLRKFFRVAAFFQK